MSRGDYRRRTSWQDRSPRFRLALRSFVSIDGVMKFWMVAVFLLGFSVVRAEVGREYILLSGGPSLEEWEKYKAEPHDRWWGNFIRAARVRIQEIQKKTPGAQITWLVHRPSYQRRGVRQDKSDILGNITSVRDKYGVNLVWFDQGQEVIDYLNQGKPRNLVKIANFEFYGHSNRACFMFDYSNEIDSGSKSWLHENELSRIHRGLFTRDAFIKSWGCHSGESMTKKWRRATGKKMIGAIGKTDYAYGHLRNWVPGLSQGSRWGG
jgi:hypothetical protein